MSRPDFITEERAGCWALRPQTSAAHAHVHESFARGCHEEDAAGLWVPIARSDYPETVADLRNRDYVVAEPYLARGYICGRPVQGIWGKARIVHATAKRLVVDLHGRVTLDRLGLDKGLTVFHKGTSTAFRLDPPPGATFGSSLKYCHYAPAAEAIG